MLQYLLVWFSLAVAALDSPALQVITDTAFLDISVNGQAAGRIELGLFGLRAPLTVANFIGLCTQKFGYGYPGSKFHRIIDQFMIQGGDFTNGDGTGGHSIYGNKFDDEYPGLTLAFSQPGLLAMANSGPNTNGGQFFITTVATPWLDGKHVIFGRVTAGLELVDTLQKIQGTPPPLPVVITKSGLVSTSLPTLAPTSRAPSPAPFVFTGPCQDSPSTSFIDSFTGESLPCSRLLSYCGDAAFGSQLIRECPLTCGACRGSTCLDRARSGYSKDLGGKELDCSELKDYCDHASYSISIKAACPRTCGLCS